jgi:hypothetical protein
VVLVTSNTVDALVVVDNPHSSNSIFPFCSSRAEPAKKENTGASLSIHWIVAVLAV